MRCQVPIVVVNVNEDAFKGVAHTINSIGSLISLGLVVRLIFYFVTVNPEWIVGSSGHSECSDVFLICVVERAHVVWNI